MSPQENFDLNLDSTPIIEWLARARKEGKLDRNGLRRSLIARLIWKVSYQSSNALIENVAYLMGSKVWGDNQRQTLANDILLLRRDLLAADHRLSYRLRFARGGYYFHGRPTLDPQLERRMIGAIREVDSTQISASKHLSPAQQFAKMMSMIDFVETAGVYRLQKKLPYLKETEALYIVHQGKVAEYVGRKA